MPQKCPKSLCGVCGGGVWVCKPNLVKCFGPRLRLWTWTLDFVPGPSFSIYNFLKTIEHSLFMPNWLIICSILSYVACVYVAVLWMLCSCSITALRLLVQACLRAPPVVADEAKLAIVFTYFFLLSFFFFFFLLRLLLFTHFGESPVRENLFPPIFWHN